MNTYRIALLRCLAFAAAFFAIADFVMAEVTTPPQAMSLTQAVNKAGRQRMLTQRIVKAYAQIGQEITPPVSRRQLEDAVQLFETQLDELTKIAPDARSRGSVEQMAKLWQPFKALATGPVSRSGVERLLVLDEQLVTAAHELTVELQNRAATPVDRLVNLSGRQRMLSQRMAKFYLLRAWGVESAVISREIGSARAEFDGALATLQAAPESTDAIRRELAAVALQWEWFQNALGLEGAAAYGLIVANASEAILDSMEVITFYYERLPAR